MGKYKTIVIDPPWRYKGGMIVTGNAPGRTKYLRESKQKYLIMVKLAETLIKSTEQLFFIPPVMLFVAPFLQFQILL